MFHARNEFFQRNRKGAIGKSSLKKKLSAATNEDPWGPATELMQDIADQSYN